VSPGQGPFVGWLTWSPNPPTLALTPSTVAVMYDRQLLKPIVDWVNSDRSDRGNAHHHRDGDVLRADAWLAIHVAGALMVRLSNQGLRDIPAARAKREQDAAEKARAQRSAAAPPSSSFDENPSSRFDDSVPF